MEWADYLRDEAAKYRQLAEQTDDPVTKNEMLELASVCEEVPLSIRKANLARLLRGRPGGDLPESI
jgi:hypothetical protein